MLDQVSARTSATSATEDQMATFEATVKAGRTAGPVVVPHVIGGVELYDGPQISREDPSFPSMIVSACHDAPADTVRRAVDAARGAQKEWARLTPSARADRIRRGLDLLTADRMERIAGVIALETGKNRTTSLLDIQEVAKFFELYCDYVSQPGAFDDPLEGVGGPLTTRSLLRPYGVFGIIVPFNYPAALAAGPTLAALLAGNGVVIKPPHLAPRSSHELFAVIGELDLPSGLVNIVHGGDDTGRALVASDVDGIAFTGSADAGLSIVSALQAAPYPRPVIAEMGGKNSVIVTDGARCEDAVNGIAFSAFDLAGQKCSACSRVLATPGIYDDLVHGLAERADSLHFDEPLRTDADAGPVISRAAMQRYELTVRAAQRDGRVVAGGRRLEAEGYFAVPTVVADLPSRHQLARKEHFLPFLTVSRVENFDEAIAEANGLNVGLTAGIYTGDPDEARRFLDEIEAGCVDVNNPNHATTGFWPGRQTFGGWKGSASTGKLGFGRWYVPQFAREQCRTVPTEL
jgi:1-pyrroline-5-carboxylate dehydrogenase